MLVLLINEVYVKDCSLLVGLLSMCEIMGLHMYIIKNRNGIVSRVL